MQSARLSSFRITFPEPAKNEVLASDIYIFFHFIMGTTDTNILRSMGANSDNRFQIIIVGHDDSLSYFIIS